MNQQQFLGQLRAVLTAIGTMLATWGLSDGQQWTPVIGIVLALVSLTWGLLHHRDPATPGRLSWSLFRKTLNVCGSAAVAYGLLHPDKLSSMAAVAAALGPLLASWYSWVDNSTAGDPDDDEPPFHRLPLLLLMAAATCLLLGACAGGGLDLRQLPPIRIETPWGSGSKAADGTITLIHRATVIPEK